MYVLGFFAVISVLIPYLVSTNSLVILEVDAPFHINRLLSYSESLKNGIVEPSISFDMLGGLGYISPIFYKNTLLLPFSLLSILGMKTTTVFYIMLATIIMGTFIVSFFYGNTFFKNKKYSFLFSVLYTLSPYIVRNIVVRGAVGEMFANLFFPIALFSFLNILRGKRYDRWYHLSIGLFLVFLSHTISAFITVIFFIILYLLNLTVRTETLEKTKTFFKSGLLFTGISLYIFLPMIVVLSNQTLNAGTNKIYHLGTFFIDYATEISETILLVSLNIPLDMSIGFFSFLFLILGIFTFKKLEPVYNHILIICLVGLFVKFFMADTGLLDKTFLDTLQFGWRIYFVIVPFSLALGIEIIRNFGGFTKSKWFYLFISIYSMICSVGFVYVYSQKLLLANNKRFEEGAIVSEVFYQEYINNTDSFIYDIGEGAEYLPSDLPPRVTDLTKIEKNVISLNNLDSFDNVSKNKGNISLTITSNKKDSLQIPFIYYKHFFKVELDGKPLNYDNKGTGLISVDIPENSKGNELTVSYKTPYFVSITKLISFVVLIGFTFKNIGFKIIKKQNT